MIKKQSVLRMVGLALALSLIGGCTSASGSRTADRCSSDQGNRPCNVVGGFGGNWIPDGVLGVTIGGGGQRGFENVGLLDFAMIGGGKANRAGNLATVGGGINNQASGILSTVGGGTGNRAERNGAVIAGGYTNLANQSFTTIGGGRLNVASGSMATVGGGSGNLSEGRFTAICGGTRNQAVSAYAVISGGSYNQATGGTSVIAGGTRNQAAGIGSAIGGGAGNTVDGLQSSICGGLGNRVTENYGVVSGGRDNQAGNANLDPQDAYYAVVGGGSGNLAGGAFSVVPGGTANKALGDFSFAVGRMAQVDREHDGAFLFADSSDVPFTSSSAKEFAVRATGGVRFVTALDTNGKPSAGVRLGHGEGAWESLSDREAKTSVLPVDGRLVLDKLVDVPISIWRYKGEPAGVFHMGPMAQDFRAVYGLGQDARYISTIDADGVALAAIQGLYHIAVDKDEELDALRIENRQQAQRLSALEARLAQLEKGANRPVQTSYWVSSVALCLALIMALRGRYNRYGNGSGGI